MENPIATALACMPNLDVTTDHLMERTGHVDLYCSLFPDCAVLEYLQVKRPGTG